MLTKQNCQDWEFSLYVSIKISNPFEVKHFWVLLQGSRLSNCTSWWDIFMYRQGKVRPFLSIVLQYSLILILNLQCSCFYYKASVCISFSSFISETEITFLFWEQILWAVNLSRMTFKVMGTFTRKNAGLTSVSLAKKHNWIFANRHNFQ